MGFDFNLPNFGIGFGAGALTSLVAQRIYRIWREREDNRLPVPEKESPAGYGKLRPYAVRSGDRRYLANLSRIAQSAHLAGQRVALTDILVEPRFIPPEPLARAADDDSTEPSIWENIPIIADFPYLHAPYNVPTLSIEDLGKGARAVAVLGEPGSGRTTALYAIALWSMGQLDFQAPPDVVQEMLDAEASKLDAKTRAERIKRNQEAAFRARERIAVMQGKKEEVSDIARQDSSELPVLRQVSPIYVHLNNVLVRRGGYGSNVDPAEPLVRAVQAQVRWLTSRTAPRGLYRQLVNGKALVLIDGLDDVPPDQRAEKWAWLRAFMATYSQNFIIMTAPASGYHQAVELGMVPVTLRPWNDADLARVAGRWADKWMQISGTSTAPGETVTARMKKKNRARNPYDLTLRLWSEYAGVNEVSQSEHAERYLALILKNAADWQPNLRRMAASQLDDGYITLPRLVQLERDQPLGIPGSPPRSARNTAKAAVPAPKTASQADAKQLAEFEALLDDEDHEDIHDMDDDEDGADEIVAAPGEDKQTTRERRRIAREQSRAINTLLKAGILVRYRGNRYQFKHYYLASYLAALWLQNASEDMLVDRTHQPMWRQALAYANQLRPMEAAIRTYLDETPDVLFTSVLELTRWLMYAGKKAEWRGKLLSYLGSLFAAENQFLLARERIAAALVSAWDDGAFTIFRRAIQNENPDVRKLCCLALGAMRDVDSSELLRDIMQKDEEYDDVQVAGAMALGVMATPQAFDFIATELEVAPVQDVRRAITETLAANAEDGYSMLYQAIHVAGDEDDFIKLRRAAVFGLARVRTNWALISLNEVLLDANEQDYVQLAAEIALENIYLQSRQGIHSYPAPDDIGWLATWREAQEMTGKLPEDHKAGNPLLVFALMQQKEPELRRLAAVTVGQYGVVEAARTLYQALTDPQELIRDAAFRALGQIQMRVGKPLPLPV